MYEKSYKQLEVNRVNMKHGGGGLGFSMEGLNCYSKKHCVTFLLLKNEHERNKNVVQTLSILQ
jgi:hypothetical protein